MKMKRNNRKEVKHIVNESNHADIIKSQCSQYNRRVRIENMKNRVKIQNQLNMENHNRFKNVVLGYSIQAERIMNFVQSSTSSEITNKVKVGVEQATKLMKKVQLNLLLLEDMQEKYNKHTNNSIWCKYAISPFAKKLEQIIIDVDLLVKDGDGNES